MSLASKSRRAPFRRQHRYIRPFTPASSTFTLGQATESDSAQPLTITKLLTLGQATETDTARALRTAFGRFPATVSGNGRYILDQFGDPWMMHGDTAWDLWQNLSLADAQTYLDDRASRGVNLVIVEMEHFFTTTPPQNLNGDLPFTGTAFQSSLNEPYWAHVDEIVDYAATKGITVMFFPCYMGFPGTDEGWNDEIVAASNANMDTYGAAIGNRYKDRINIIWAMSGDKGVGLSATELDRLDHIATAIRGTGDTHLMTAHGQSSADAASVWDSYTWLDLNSVYARGTNVISTSATAYGRSTVRPTFLIEGRYDNHTSNPTFEEVRAEQWRQFLVGGLGGQIVGNEAIWSFGFNTGFSNDGYDWAAHLADQSIDDAMYVANLVENHLPGLWQDLAPDLTDTFLTSGESSGATQAAASFSTACAVVYVSTTGSITVDLTEITDYGTVQARWYDPTTGGMSGLGSFSTSAPHTFSHPGNNASGDDDWVLVITQSDTIVVGQAEETDTSQPLTITKTITLGQAAESDSASALTETKSFTLGQSTESDTSQALAFSKSTSVGQTTESDSAQAVTLSKTITLGQATETDSATSLAFGDRSFTTGQTSETDAANPLALSKTITLGQASETDSATALTFTKTITLGQAEELDEARPLSFEGEFSFELGQASETDTAQPITVSKSFTLGQATETDTAQALSFAVTHSIGQPSETDSATALVVTKTFTLGQASETDTATPLSFQGETTFQLGQASETDTAQALVVSKTLTLGQATETDAATALTFTKTKTLGQSTETDAAQPLNFAVVHGVGQSSESDSATALTFTKTITLGQASETDEALALNLPDTGPPDPSPTDQVYDILVGTPAVTINVSLDQSYSITTGIPVYDVDI